MTTPSADDSTNPADSNALADLKARARSLVDSATERVAATVAAGRHRVAAVRDGRERSALLEELGAAHYDAHRSGRAVDSAVVQRVVADLDSLQERVDDADQATTDSASIDLDADAKESDSTKSDATKPNSAKSNSAKAEASKS